MLDPDHLQLPEREPVGPGWLPATSRARTAADQDDASDDEDRADDPGGGDRLAEEERSTDERDDRSLRVEAIQAGAHRVDLNPPRGSGGSLGSTV